MAGLVGAVIGAAMAFLLLFVVILAVGRIGALRPHALAVHVIGVGLVWLAAIGISPTATSPLGAYLVTLLAIWDYRRDIKKPASGWYRLGAGITILWLLIGLLVLNGSLPASEDSLLVGAWVYTVLGMAPWLLGWLIQWIRQGFKGTLAVTK